MADNRLEELLKKPFRVAMNLRLQAFYKDKLILLTSDNNISREIDASKEDASVVIRNIVLGNLNIVDEAGNIIYESFGVRTSTVKKIVLPNIDTEDTVTDKELEFVRKLVNASVGTITTNISRMTKAATLLALRNAEETRRPRPRISVLTAIDQRIEQLKQIVLKAGK